MLHKRSFTLTLIALLLSSNFRELTAQEATAQQAAQATGTEAAPIVVTPSDSTPTNPTPTDSPLVAPALPDIVVAPSAVASDALNGEDSSSGNLIALRLNLRAGQKFRVIQTSQVKTVSIIPATASRPSRKQETWSNDAATMLMRVLYVQSDGSYRMHITFESFSSRPLVFLDQKSAAQSAKSRAITNAMSRTVRNKAVDLALSPTGLVSDVRGLGVIWRDLSNSLASSKLTALELREARLSIENWLSESYIAGIFDRAGMSFPESPLRVGDAWNLRLSPGGSLPFVTNVQRTLQSRRNAVLTVIENGTLRLNNTQVSSADSNTSFTVNLSGTYTGTTQLDEATGFARSTGFTQRFSGTISAKSANSNIVTTSMFGRVFTKTTAQEVR